MDKILISYNKIEIIGSVKYVNRVLDALKLLRRKAPDKFRTVKKYVGRIEEYCNSGMYPWENTPTFYMSKKVAFYSLTWCASCIAHDAYHSKQYLDYRRKHKNQVPRAVYYGRKAELESFKYQILVSKQIKAPKHEIDHLKSQDGMHYKSKEIW